MKKITAFFMALLPFFVTVLLFISGLIVKDMTHVYVQSVSLPDTTYEIQKTDDKSVTVDFQATVLPKTAYNQKIYYSSANTNIVSYSDEGVLEAKDFGTTYVTAVSQENPQKNASCKVEVWDDKVHEIKVSNTYELGYLSHYETKKIDVTTVPSTRISKDKKLKFEVICPSEWGQDLPIRVSQDGEVTALKPSNADHNEATIKITSETFPDAKPCEVKVKVGPGVKMMECKDYTPIITSDTTYNLKSQLLTFPDDISKVSDEELQYSSSDENTATVDTKGIVTFKKAGEVNVTATYKRNKDVYTTKSITSTSNKFLDVSFNRYSITEDISSFTDGVITPNQVGWSVFPEGNNTKEVTITSSNTDVVEVQQTEQGPKLLARNPGQTTLTASIKVDEQTTKSDTCFVTLTKEPTNTNGSSIFKNGLDKSNPLVLDSYYYSLRDNLELTRIYKNTYDKATWKVVDPETAGTTDIAYLDTDNEVLHFKKEGLVKVSLTVNNKEYTFFAKANKLDDITFDYDNAQLEVGKSYKLNEGDYPFLESLWESSWTQYFDLTFGDDGYLKSFIPKKGGSITLPIQKSTQIIFWKNIDFKIHEQPKSINYQKTLVGKTYNTSALEVKINDGPAPVIYPSTASDKDGTLYSASMKYTVSINEEVGSYDEEEKKITFLKPGQAKLTIELGDEYKDEVIINSKAGGVGKFTLKDTASNEIVSGNTLKLAPGETKTLELTSLLDGLDLEKAYSYFFIDKVITQSDLTVTKLPYVAGEPIKFTITAPADGGYTEPVCIHSSDFNLFLNVEVSTKIQNFVVSYHGQTLNSLSNNVTFTKNLKLDVAISPISLAKTDAFTATWNGTTISHAGSYELDLSSLTWQASNTLVISDANNTSISKTYTIEYKDHPTDFTLTEAEADGKIYINPADTQTYVSVHLGGFADDSVFDNFSLKVNGTKLEDKARSVNKFVISNITDPAVDPNYEADIELVYNDGKPEAVSKQFHITREIVSRVTFPGHDNFDQSDKKGLQKVHVYGNASYYSPEEGLLNYYKLPIKIYDYKNDEFCGEAKKKAFDSLTKTINNGASYVYHEIDANNKESFIEIHFDSKNTYSTEEMYNNAFDNLINKNVTFTATTHLYNAYSRYTFVPVVGCNVYCQEGLNYTNDNINKSVILQLNFGFDAVDPKAANTTKFDKPIIWFGHIYGNGYTINVGELEKGGREGKFEFTNFFTTHALNTIFQGSHSTITLDIVKSRFAQWWELKDEDKYYFFAYNAFKRADYGIAINTNDGKPVRIKNCLFYDCGRYAINEVKGHKCTVYLEDSVFFNCASFAINLTESNQIFFKGFINIYNFQGEHMLEPYGPAKILFPALLRLANLAGMKTITADGKEVINSCFSNIMGKPFMFYVGKDEKGNDRYVDEYSEELGKHELAANHINPFGSLPIGEGNLAMWSTQTPDRDQGAPNYYDEYNPDGTLRADFLSKQLALITRIPVYF